MIKTTFISMAPAAWVQFTAEQHLVSVTCGEKHVNIWKPAAEFDLFLMLMYSKEHFDSAGFFHHSLLTEKILPSCFVPDWLLSLIFGRVCVGSVGSWSRSIQASPSTAGGTGWGQRYFLFVNANTSVWGTRFTSLVLICSYCHCISVESGAVWPGAAHQHVLLQHHWQTLSYTSVHELWSVRWQYWRLPPSRVKEHVHRSIGVFFFYFLLWPFLHTECFYLLSSTQSLKLDGVQRVWGRDGYLAKKESVEEAAPVQGLTPVHSPSLQNEGDGSHSQTPTPTPTPEPDREKEQVASSLFFGVSSQSSVCLVSSGQSFCSLTFPRIFNHGLKQWLFKLRQHIFIKTSICVFFYCSSHCRYCSF